jgi:PAS domain S-box-containing protein
MSASSRNVTSATPDGVSFEVLVNAITDYAIYRLDQDGIIASGNPGAERQQGYQPHEIVGQPYSLFFTPEDRVAGVPDRILAEARANGRCEAEGWRVGKDGSQFWVQAVLETIRSPTGELIGFTKVARDITKRRQAEQRLVERERRFRILVEGVIDYAIFLLDPSGVVTNWNAGAQKIKGYTAEEIVGHHFSRFYTNEDRAVGLPAKVLEIAVREGRYESEGWRLRKDGTRFWAAVVVDAIRDEKGQIVGFAKVTRDATKKREAQEALRQSERQFRLLVGGVTDYAFIMLDPNGIVSSWNAGAEKIKGYKATEIIGEHFSKFYTEEDRTAGLPLRSLGTALAEGRFEAEGLRVRKDGTVFWANVIIDPVRDEKGELIGYAKITRDITERREAQRNLQEAQLQLAHSQKMEALGQLTGGVAHDFNNLLMVVSGHVRKIRKAAAGNPGIMQSAQFIEEAVSSGVRLTRQLLTFSRRQSLDPVYFFPSEAIENIRAMLADSIGGAPLVTAIPADIWPVHADLGEFDAAIVNIVINARDAMPDGGTISITGENTHLHFDSANLPVQGDYVCLAVADTGTGIAPDILPKIFEPFFTTKKVGKGTGLGLSQVHGFVHQSGGSIVVKSEPGKGTRVSLYFPRARAGDLLSAAVSERGKDVHVRGSALVVDDNAPVLEITKFLLEDLGFKVRAAGDSHAALAAFDEGSFDLVLSDIVMPGPMNGLQLARAIRERHPDVPIILATGYSEFARDAAKEFFVLRKPFQLSDLSDAVAELSKGRTPVGDLIRCPPKR